VFGIHSDDLTAKKIVWVAKKWIINMFGFGRQGCQTEKAIYAEF
jgi:hypothetical protein